MTTRVGRGLAFVACIAVGVFPEILVGQESDNAIFHYSLMNLDVSRSPGPAVGAWEGGGWIGTDYDRLWWSTFGEGADGTFTESEVMLLYGRYVRTFWDLVVGYRREVRPIGQGYLAFGLTGLAPYWFEGSVLGFVSEKGKPSARLEAKTDLYLTQRMVLQPSVRTDWLVIADDEVDLGAGLRTVEVGFRGRYEVRRKFAPYFDLRWVREKEARAGGSVEADSEGFRLGVGIRLIY